MRRRCGARKRQSRSSERSSVWHPGWYCTASVTIERSSLRTVKPPMRWMPYPSRNSSWYSVPNHGSVGRRVDDSH